MNIIDINRLISAIKNAANIPTKLKEIINKNFDAAKIPDTLDNKDEFGKAILTLYVLQALKKALDNYQPDTSLLTKLFKQIDVNIDRTSLKETIEQLLTLYLGENDTLEERIKKKVSKYIELINGLKKMYYVHSGHRNITEISFTNTANMLRILGGTAIFYPTMEAAYNVSADNPNEVILKLERDPNHPEKTSSFLIESAEIHSSAINKNNRLQITDQIQTVANPYYYKNYTEDFHALVVQYKPVERSQRNPFATSKTTTEEGNIKLDTIKKLQH